MDQNWQLWENSFIFRFQGRKVKHPITPISASHLFSKHLTSFERREMSEGASESTTFINLRSDDTDNISTKYLTTCLQHSGTFVFREASVSSRHA